MEAQCQINLKLVIQHEKLHCNLNEHLGGLAPFIYTTSPWGLDSSREGSIVSSNGEFEMAPVQESSQPTAPIPNPPPGAHTLEELAMRALKAQQYQSTHGIGSSSSHNELSSSFGPISPSPKKPSLKASSPGLEYVDEYTQKVQDTYPLRYADPEVIDHWMRSKFLMKLL